MKSIEQVKSMMSTIEGNVNAARYKKDRRREINELRKLASLRSILNYLSISPNEESLKRQKLELQTIIKSKKEQYELWLRSNVTEHNEKKNRREFNKQLGLTTLRRKLRFINIILN